MAGKIALWLIAFILVGVTSYLAGWYRRQETMIECTVIQVVTNHPEQNQNARGIPTPYTVVGYQPKHTAFVLPGILGQPGDAVKIPAEK